MCNESSMSNIVAKLQSHHTGRRFLTVPTDSISSGVSGSETDVATAMNARTMHKMEDAREYIILKLIPVIII